MSLLSNKTNASFIAIWGGQGDILKMGKDGCKEVRISKIYKIADFVPVILQSGFLDLFEARMTLVQYLLDFTILMYSLY